MMGNRLVSLSKSEKAKFISDVIFRLTIDGRAKYSETPPDISGMAQIIEDIHHAVGYLILVLDGERLEAETLLAESLLESVLNSSSQGTRKLLSSLSDE
jgi:hypothetical protein